MGVVRGRYPKHVERGAVQLSWVQLTCASHPYGHPPMIGWPADYRDAE